ncbi:MAG: alpha-N-acetylglucosaminidase TIM-barrel domain-containing protein [Longicatena sp.]
MKKIVNVGLSLLVLLAAMPFHSIVTKGAEIKIDILGENIKAKSKSTQPSSNMADKNIETYWESIPSNGEGDNYKRMYDHNRYVDIKLDAIYDLSEIKVFNKVDGSFNNYYVYTSLDGVNFDKVVSKTNNSLATATGDSFKVTKKASYIRLNMAYNSNSFTTNLAEIELFGGKVTDVVTKPKEIKTEDWNGSSWQQEWDKFENDQKYADDKTIAEAKNLVGRVVGDKWKSNFEFVLSSVSTDTKDKFAIEDAGKDKIKITGNNGIALASGFNYYLKNYVNVDYNPLFGSNVNLVGMQPIGKKIVKDTQYDIRYALNFCTYSYTMSFWGWDEYEKFIDWAAMNGINLMLDIVGQEEVLRQTLKEYNYSDEEIKDYISGPAYFAWFYMQNMYSYGGPLPDAWFEQRVEVGRKMHDRMQTYGIQPVIQGFAGQVPETFAQKNEGAVLTPFDQWPSFTRPSIIKTYLSEEEVQSGKKNFFPNVANKFYEKQKNVFGNVSNYYASDPFHEGGNTTGLNVTDIYKQVQSEMLKSNPEAIWVMQQWQGNLNNEKINGLIKPEQALALDLQSDMNKQYGLFEQKNIPWVYNMLHNFGGRMGLDGEVEKMASDPTVTFNSTKNMKGIGITPEALENSPIVYEMLFDMTWSKDPIDYRAWTNKYAERRAGGTSDSLQSAWNILLDTAYKNKGESYQGAAETVINSRPTDNFNSASTWGNSTIRYDKKELDKALVLLTDNYAKFKESPAFKYDLADVAEQVLCNAAIEYQRLMVKAKNNKETAEFKKLSDQFLALIDLSDQILNTSDEFMVGTWINDARTMLIDADDWTKDLFEFNARSLITTWGGERSGSLKDYSNRKWAGLTKDFYKPRWQMWVNNRMAELTGTAKNSAEEKAESNWFLWEWQWVNRKSDDGFAYSHKPSTDNLGELATKAFEQFSTTNITKFTDGSVDDKVNIAKGKTVTSTSETLDGKLANITDNTTGTGWTAKGAGPHVLEIDLEGSYALDELIISVKQAATDYPFDYKVETFNPENSTWEIVAEHINETMRSNESIVTKNVASKIRFTIESRDVTSYPVYISEIAAYGTAKEVKKYTNLAKGIVPTTNKTNTDTAKPLSNITDDDITSIWKTTSWGAGDYPADVKVDLDGVVFADFIEIYLEKAGLPFKFFVEVELKDGTKEEILTKYKEHSDVITETSFKIPVNKDIKSVSVHMTGITGKGEFNVAGPALAEIKVLSTKTIVKEVNVAKGKNVTSSKNNPAAGYELTKIVDEDITSFWKTSDWGPSSFPATVTVDLGKVYNVDNIELYFEQANTPFKFKVQYYDENDSLVESALLDRTSQTGTNEKSYKIPVKKNITKILVNMTGTTSVGAISGAGPAIAEIKAISKGEVEEDPITFKDGKIDKITVDSAYENTTDGNKDTFVGNIKDKEIVYDLGKQYYVGNIDLTFEKEGLGLCYKVYGEDTAGVRTLILDASQSTSLLANRTLNIPVNMATKKIIFVHLGNNGGGSASLAETRLYEFEAFGSIPESAAKTGTTDIVGAETILDGKADTQFQFAKNQQVVISLDKAKDINMISVQKTSNEQAVSKFLVEYAEETPAREITWKSFIDYSANESLKERIFVTGKEPVYTKQLRITFIEAINISEVGVYEIDRTKPLADRIGEIEKIVAGKTYDGLSGSFKQESRDVLEAVLADAKAAYKSGLNSKTCAEWIEKINKALDVFYKTGIVYINRETLLLKLSEADALMQIFTNYGMRDVTAEIKAVYTPAKTVYDTFKVTQTTIDGEVTKLQAIIDSSILKLELPKQVDLKIALAQAKVDASVVGELQGNVSQESKDSLIASIEKAKVDLVAANGEESKLNAIITALDQAIKSFTDSAVVIKMQELTAIIKEAEDKVKGIYDVDSWNVFEGSLKKAKDMLSKNDVTQKQVDAITEELKTSMMSLKELDKTNLIELLGKCDNLKENEYTKKSWKAYSLVKEEVLNFLKESYLSQKDVDANVIKLTKAMDLLEKSKPISEVLANEKTIASLKGFMKQIETLNMNNYTKEQQKIINDFAKQVADALQNDKLTQKEADVLLSNMKKIQVIIDNVTINTPDIKPVQPNGDSSSSDNANTGDNVNTSDNANTGDKTNTIMIVLTLGISAMILGFVVIKKRKNNL